MRYLVAFALLLAGGACFAHAGRDIPLDQYVYIVIGGLLYWTAGLIVGSDR